MSADNFFVQCFPGANNDGRQLFTVWQSFLVNEKADLQHQQQQQLLLQPTYRS